MGFFEPEKMGASSALYMLARCFLWMEVR